ncbi:MAG: FAD-binding oxidoreductase [Fidelibacterota bacterium]|nr:MAG: FAD-binding oxidoreductase [Candidatus Neomarinimicrobiota bacterium]
MPLRPKERSNVGELIRQARTRRVPVGSTGSHPWDLSRLNKTIAFDTPDMLLTVETGQTLAAAKDMVEAERLWLPLDMPGDSYLSLAEYLTQDHSLSWLSSRYGAARDWITRLTAVDDEGREVACGAKVVKNVAGYQWAPLYIGAGDALGPIVEVSFRLLPLPTSISCGQWEGKSPSSLMGIWRQGCQDSHPTGRGDPWEAIRLTRHSSQWRMEGITRFPPDAVANWGRPVRDQIQEAITTAATPPRETAIPDFKPVHRIQVLPTQIAGLLDTLAACQLDLSCYPASGIIHAGPIHDDQDKQTYTAMLDMVIAKGGRVQPLRAGAHVNRQPGRDPSGERTIMTRVKSILDPEGVFGPLPENRW